MQFLYREIKFNFSRSTIVFVLMISLRKDDLETEPLEISIENEICHPAFVAGGGGGSVLGLLERIYRAHVTDSAGDAAGAQPLVCHSKLPGLRHLLSPNI